MTIRAPAANVWQALTIPQLLTDWMTSYGIKMMVETDWQIGSPIRFTGDLHGMTYVNKGVIKTFKPEKCLEYSFWSSLSQLDDQAEFYSLLSFHLEERAEVTSLQLNQGPFLLETMMKHSEFYWKVALAKLKDKLEFVV